MSHKYICDCCGENLYQFDEDAIGHFKTIDSEKDYCPWCTNYISEHADSAITMFKHRLKGCGNTLIPPEDSIMLLTEMDEYNDNYRRW